MTLLDRVKNNLREWYTLAADRTGEVAKISARRYDKFGLSREIERQFSELGSFVYHALEEGRTEIADAPEVHQVVARVKELEQDLERKEAEIEEIRLVRQQKQAEAAARQQAETAAAAAAATAAGAAGDSDPAASAGGEPEIEVEPEPSPATPAGPPPDREMEIPPAVAEPEDEDPDRH